VVLVGVVEEVVVVDEVVVVVVVVEVDFRRSAFIILFLSSFILVVLHTPLRHVFENIILNTERLIKENKVFYSVFSICNTVCTIF
jgi:hypothetical protein